MRDLLICVLAMTWAWGLIWYLGRRKHPYERPDHIDRDFREMAAQYTVGCVFMDRGGTNRAVRKCWLEARHDGDHDFRDLVARAGNEGHLSGPWHPTSQELVDQRERCPAHGWSCDNGAAEAKRREAARRSFRHAHDEHGASTYSPDIIDQANRAHTTGQVRCPIHGSPCGRAKRARETGLSQTDEDVARRASPSDGIKSTTLGYSDDDGKTWFTKPGGVDGPSTD